MLYHSAIPTDSPGRVDKAAAITALQHSGESYDRVRETLKDVSVDASGKVELEDWVEVRHKKSHLCTGFNTYCSGK